MATRKERAAARASDIHDAERALAGKLARVRDDLARDEATSGQSAGPVETRYARSGDLSIAYQVAGSGPDVVFVPGSLSHVELGWETPPMAAIFRRLSGFARMITFDKRGTGLSDRRAELPTLEERMDDVRAVMDAADCKKAAVVGISEGGPMALLFAATYPERVTALVLWATFARMAWAPDYAEGVDAQEAEQFCDQVEESWGHGRVWPMIAIHDAPDDEATRRHLAHFERNSATPAMAGAANRFSLHIDARHALSAISAPTLVVHRSGDPLVNVAHARYLAANIPGSRLAEFPGDFHESGIGKDEDILDEIEEFLTGTRQQHEIDRVLKTILFTDIVGSTERAVRMGDRRWRELLDTHDSTCVASSSASTAKRCRRWATGFSSPSMGLPGRSVARGRSPTRPAPSASRSEPACTAANARPAATIWPASPCTSERASVGSQTPARCWSPALCATW